MRFWPSHASLAVIAVCATGLILPAKADQFGLFTFVDQGTTIEITDYPGDATGNVEIPAEINGKPVTRIGNNAFNSCQEITSITIPDTVTTLGNSAFYFCRKLTAIQLPAGVTSIGSSAFSTCSELASINIPAGVTSIESNTFGYCKKLSEISIPANVTVIGTSAFEGCLSLGEIAFPSGVTSISESLFRFCEALESVTMPPTVTSVGALAFSSCPKLDGITLPETVTNIGSHAFEYSGLTSITIPASVATIGDRAFDSCEPLASINVAPANTSYSSISGILLNKLQTQLILCPSKFAGNCAIPVTVTGINNGAFSGCSLLTGVTLPPGLSRIGDSVFNGCTGLTNVSVPSGVTRIGQWAFRDCSSLASVTIPPTVTAIDFAAFWRCHSLTEVTIPASVTSMYAGFSDCSSLTAIHVDAANPAFSSKDGVLFNKQQTQLHAFPGGWGGSYVIPPTVTRVEDYAFLNCAILRSVSFPSGVTYLGYSAFNGCSKLESVTIPSSVSTFGSFVFSKCEKLKSALFLGSAPSAGNGIFGDVSAGFKVYYFSGASGFTSPIWLTGWNSYPSVNMGAYSPKKPWLVSHEFSHDTDLNSDPNQDGVNLLLAYGLNLDPNLNLASSMPMPVVANDGLSIRFYAGNPNVTYAVQASSTLAGWTSEGVVLSAPDQNQWRTAIIPTSANPQFLRLVIEE